MPARPSLNMVWSSASSTLIGPFVFGFSANTHPLRFRWCVRKGIVSSRPMRATVVSLYFDVVGQLSTVCGPRVRVVFTRVLGRFSEVERPLYGVRRSSGELLAYLPGSPPTTSKTTGQQVEDPHELKNASRRDHRDYPEGHGATHFPSIARLRL